MEEILIKAKPTNPDVAWDNIVKSFYIILGGKIIETINNNFFKIC